MSPTAAEGRRERLRRFHDLDLARRHRSGVEPQGRRELIRGAVRKLTIDVRPGEYVVARLDAAAAVPPRLLDPNAGFVSVTRTESELSVVCPAELAPAGADIESGGRVRGGAGPWNPN